MTRMRLTVSQDIYDLLPPEDKAQVKKLVCSCLIAGEHDVLASPDCEFCDGKGYMYDVTPDDETMREIENNLRSHGMPLPKEGLS